MFHFSDKNSGSDKSKSPFDGIGRGLSKSELGKIKPSYTSPTAKAKKHAIQDKAFVPDVFGLNSASGFTRRTDASAKKLALNWPRDHAVQSDCHRASLKNAAAGANVSGVYILYLNGKVMKVGSAEIGVQKRMQQYYGMNPSCGLPQITPENRSSITAVWQDCPVCKCNELESKLSRKYGLGPWAKRMPHSTDDTWKLLI